MPVNPFDYSRKTFLQIYNELKTLWPSKPDWFETLMSGRADVLHWYLDARAQNLFIESAFTREAMLSLTKLINYYMNPASAAQVDVTFTLKSGTSLPKTIPKEQLICSTSGTSEVEPVRFEANESKIFNSLSETVACTQGETIFEENIGQSDGTSEWQEFNLSRKKFLNASSEITIGAETWTEVADFIDYDDLDKVFKVIVRDDDSSFVRFGDGTYGMIPPANYDIIIDYRIGGGPNGNVDANEIIVYLGTETAIESVNNPSAASGGADKESIERARRLAPLSVAAQERAIKAQDIKLLAERFSGVSRAGVIPNTYGFFSAQVQIVPYGGGNPSSQLLTDCQNYLISLSPLESIDIRCINPNYVPIGITAQIKIFPGYIWSKIEDYARVAFDLILTEKIQEVLDTYESEGIEAAKDLINSIMGYSFLTEDQNQLENILKNLSVRDWGQNVNESDLYAIDVYIDGIDYLNISAPSFPVSIENDEITTEGTHIITQI